MVERDKPEESELTLKLKELATIQALVTLPEYCTPSNHTLQRPSTNAVALQFSVPSPSSSKVEEVITYGDVSLDEEIVLPKYDYVTMMIEKMGILKKPWLERNIKNCLGGSRGRSKLFLMLKISF